MSSIMYDAMRNGRHAPVSFSIFVLTRKPVHSGRAPVGMDHPSHANLFPVQARDFFVELLSAGSGGLLALFLVCP